MINHFEKISTGNFGDDLNEVIWTKLFGKPIEEIGESDHYFFGIGTRLRRKNIPEGKKITVFGSGYGYETIPPKVDSYWDIRCVRGPLTAEILNIDKLKAITDPAIMVKKLVSAQEKIYPISFIPHHLTSLEDDWRPICQSLGIYYIDPKNSPIMVIQEIAKSKLILTESLHGAIIADTYRTPWIPFFSRSHFSEFKWNDWASSMNLKIDFTKIRPLFNKDIRNKSNPSKVLIRKAYSSIFSSFVGDYELRNLKNKTPYLSDEVTFELRLEQMEVCVSRFLADYE